jgi:hypothetical protein
MGRRLAVNNRLPLKPLTTNLMWLADFSNRVHKRLGCWLLGNNSLGWLAVSRRLLTTFLFTRVF